MGLFTAVAKMVTKPKVLYRLGKMKTFVPRNYASRIRNYSSRIAKVYPELVFGEGTETIARAMRKTKGSPFKKAEAGWHALEKRVASQKQGFFKNLLESIKTIPKTFKDTYKVGQRAAKIHHKSAFWGFRKGVGKAIAKKMPIISTIGMAGFEIYNAYQALKDKGVVAAGQELGKSTIALGGGAVGAAIGSTILPGWGSLIGWIAGEWLTRQIVGKSYTDQKDEEEMRQEELVQTQTQDQTQPQDQTAYQQPQLTPNNPYGTYPYPMYDMNPFTQSGYPNPMIGNFGPFTQADMMGLYSKYSNDIMFQRFGVNGFNATA